MTEAELMGHYKKVREEEGINGDLGLITNPQAQVGGILLVGLNPSGEGDQIHNYINCKNDFWNPKHEMMGAFRQEMRIHRPFACKKWQTETSTY